MIRALRLLRQSLSIWYYEVFIFIAVNLLWLLLCLLVIPIGPATAGLFSIANEAAKGEPVFFSTFLAGMRRHLGVSLRLSLVIIALAAAILFNMYFYLAQASTIANVVGIVWVYVLILFGIALNYPFALMVQMEKPGVVKILRNSVLLVLDNIALSISLSVVAILLFLFSIVPLGFVPYILGLFALLAILQCKAVLQLVDKYEHKEQKTSPTGLS
jgi:uncharacterized membrane protein YesL